MDLLTRTRRGWRGAGWPGDGPGRALGGLALLLALAGLAGACASGSGGGRSAPGAESAPPDSTPLPATDAHGRLLASDPGAATPARAASTRLVERALDQRASGDAAAADRTLEAAIRLDPTNGRAYYWLAVVRIERGEERAAPGLLAKARERLRPYPEWTARVDSLSATLSP